MSPIEFKVTINQRATDHGLEITVDVIGVKPWRSASSLSLLTWGELAAAKSAEALVKSTITHAVARTVESV